MKLALRQVAECFGLETANDGVATGWSIDSRTVRPGDVFFALRGPNHDGHAYAGEVLAKGASAAVVDLAAGMPSNARGLFRVPDVLQALQQLARFAREKWGGEVIGVTGSAGKTTTKEIIAEMLSERIPTAKNEGNLNNHVGLPLSLLRLDESARVAVLEMGMNHAGEIRTLAEIAKPNAGVVTNVGWAHMEAFDSIEGIAAAKRELIDTLPPDGTAVLNVDDPRVAGFKKSYTGRSVLYGQSPEADVRAEDVEYSLDGMRFRVGEVWFETHLTGRFNVSNILAGVAVAGLHGIEPAHLTSRVRALKPGKMRGERLVQQDILIYNDCYNSNPDAVRAMLDVLRDTPARARIAVLGEMLELGHWAEPLHRDVGHYVAESGINVLIGIRGAARHMVDAALLAGLRTGAAFFLNDPREAGRLARSLAQPGDAILFKGSRGVRVELALEEFLSGGPSSVREDRN
jgi:UDP-N-acetylmuramoyl-tripeptide--D-alanyl-D-alanine ligase